jgi:FixJ family two-component response regulator
MSDKPTIFVIDDDVAVQDSLKALLESADLEVATYGSGLDFLADHERHGHGCVVLDLDLPVMSGLEVLEALAKRDSDMPVIIITGRADRATRDRSLRTGAVALLEKPMRGELLLNAIDQALARCAVSGVGD